MIALHSTSDPQFFIKTESLLAGSMYRLTRALSKLPWLFALLGLITVGLAYTFLAWIPLILLRRSNRSLLLAIQGTLSDFDERELMKIHVSYEDIIVRLESVVKRSSGFFVFKPLNTQFKLILADSKVGYKALSDFLYPDMDTPLSFEEGEELIEAFKPWREDSHNVEHPLNG